MFRRASQRYALALLTAAYMLSLVDRGLMILLLQPIKEDLQLSDTQLGLLTGIAFGLFYAVVGVPLARRADRGNRVTILAAAMGLWGVTVMCCVLVTNYLQLVLARIAAAVGESGCKPPGYSLVGDYFPETTQRTRAMSIFLAGSPLSSLISFLVGGWLNELYGWRMTFFLMGIPGLMLAAVIKATLIEPRNQVDGAPVADRTAPSIRCVLVSLWRDRSCRHLSIALILLYLMALGVGPWYAAFMMRSHGMGTGELGVWLGLIYSLGGMAGVLAGGYAASRWFADDARSQMRMSAVAVAALVPCSVAFLTLPQKYHALIALMPLITVCSICLGPVYALMQRLVADEIRATTLAVVMMLANLIGMGIGPQLVGILSDQLQPELGVDSLRYALLIMSLVALWAAWHFWLVGRTVEHDLATASRRSVAAEPAGFSNTAAKPVAEAP